MPFIHGSKAVVKLNDGTALRDLSAAETSLTFDRSKDTAEVTAFGDVAKRYIPGLKDSTFSLEGSRDATIVGYVRGAYDAAGVVAFEYYPEGSTTGKDKIAGNCIVTSFSESSPVDDANKWSAECQVDGPVTVTPVP